MGELSAEFDELAAVSSEWAAVYQFEDKEKSRF